MADGGNTKEHWNGVWKVRRGGDRADYLHKLKNMSDGINSKEYWDNIWTGKKRRYERYGMQRAWWHIKQEKPKSVLDIGCGNGRLLFGIKDEVEFCYGVDISEVAVRRMKSEFGIDGEAMDVDNLNKLDKKFDFIVCNHVLEHVIKDEQLLINCKDKMNPGGMFYCAVPHDQSYPEPTGEHVRKYTKEGLKILLEKVFGNVEMSTIGEHLIGVTRT